jgi:anti-sigma factor RsiW
MNCRSAESLFSSYVEDEISQEERRGLEAHLMGCRRCSLAMREMQSTVSLLERMPEVNPSSHFDEDLFARIRSGEGLRPSAVEMIRELLSPARLRPLYLAGAGACAMVLAFLVSPMGHGLLHTGVSAPPLSAAAPRIHSSGSPAASSAVPVPAPTAVAERATPAPSSITRSGGTPSQRNTSVVASAARTTPAADRDSIVDGSIPRQRYSDEIINDQFFLDRGREGQDPAVVPVNQTSDDGVYMIF